MKVRKCKSCKLMNHEKDRFCVFCGTPLEGDAIEQDPINITPSPEEPKDPLNPMKTVWRAIKILITVFFLFATIYTQDMIFLFGVIIPGISLLDELINLKYPEDKRFASFLHPTRKFKLYGLTLIFLNALSLGNITNLFVNEPTEEPVIEVGYEFEIEPGYEYLEPISLEDIQEKVNYKISDWTSDFEYLTLEEVNGQYTVDFDITNINNVDDAIDIFKKIVRHVYKDDTLYPYIKDFRTHFYFEGEYLYSTRLYNLFLKEMMDIDKDSSFYDRRSDTSVRLWTIINDEYEFPPTDEITDEIYQSEQLYLDAYAEWYGDLDVIMNDLYDTFIALSDNYIDNGIEPTLKEIRDMDYLNQRLQSKCESFDEITPAITYDVFHHYFSRGCHFYIKAYTIALDGFRNKSVDRVDYAYIDLDLAYYYFDQIFEDEEVVDTSSA